MKLSSRVKDAAFLERLHELADDFRGTTKLAEKAQIAHICQYYTGENEPTREVLVQLALAAGVTLDWLCIGERPKYRKWNGYPMTQRILQILKLVYEPTRIPRSSVHYHESLALFVHGLIEILDKDDESIYCRTSPWGRAVLRGEA